MIGTLVGAIAIVVLTAWFPQNRAGFLVGLALWGGVCALVATLLRNFAAYAAALAGFTAAIIAGDELGAVGGTNGDAFMLAVTRASEIWIGIICAGIVLAGTDLGSAPRRLAARLAELSCDIANSFVRTVQGSAVEALTQAARRELIRKVIALDPVIDEVKGESSRLRYHSPELQQTIDGFFAILAAWRTVEGRLKRLKAMRREADSLLTRLAPELREALSHDQPRLWTRDAVRLRRLCDCASQTLAGEPAATVSMRLLADQTAALLTGFSQVLGGLAVLTGDPTRPRRQGYRFEIHVPDWLPPIVNGGRAFATILAMEVFWIYSGWPNGASAITFAAISILLLSPRSDEAYPVAVKMTVGTTLSAMAAALMLFAGLPHVARFAGFGLLLGLYLVPVGALVALPWQPAVFTPMAANFIPLLAPANQMSYDATHFFNAATAIVIGCGAAALALRLMPPLSAEFRARRLLLLSLRDLRRLAKDPQSWTGGWEARLVARIAALPEEAEPVQRAVLVTALAAGRSIIALDESAPSLGIAFRMQAAFGSFSRGNSTDALSHLDYADQQLAKTAKSSDLNVLASHARGYILAIRDALIDHRSYFETGEAA